MSTPHVIAMCGPCGGTGKSSTCMCDACLFLSGAHPCAYCNGHGTVGPVCGRAGCDADCPACKDGAA